jgi:outer membrane lipoprotein SlyB
LIGGSKGSGLTSTLAAIAQVSTEKPGKTEPKIRVNQKIKVEVTADDGGEYVLRVKETGQEGVRLRPGTRWKVGETQKVRVLALDSEGRVTKVTT